MKHKFIQIGKKITKGRFVATGYAYDSMSEKKKVGRPPQYRWESISAVIGEVKKFGGTREKNGAYVAVPTEWAGKEVEVSLPNSVNVRCRWCGRIMIVMGWFYQHFNGLMEYECEDCHTIPFEKKLGMMIFGKKKKRGKR